MTRVSDAASGPTPPEEDLGELALADDYALNPAFVEMVVDAADRADRVRLRELVDALHPADVADLMGFLSAEYREALVPLLEPEVLAEVLSELDGGLREEVLALVTPGDLAEAMGEMDSDDAADVAGDLEDDQRDAVLAQMSEADRAGIETSLAYEEESAGRLMQREVMAAPQFWTVGQTIDHVRHFADDLPELFFDIYVVDPANRPLGAVSVSHLIKSAPAAALSAIMEPVTEIAVDLDQEEVAYIFDKYHLISAPVIDAGGRLVGQITVDDIVGVIQEESESDMLALANVSDAGRDASMVGIVRSRLPWLVVNLIAETIAVSAIAIFQDEIAKIVALAVLLPIISSLGNNASVQTLAVAVRALASRELNATNTLRVIWREIAAAIVNGVLLSVMMGAAVMLFYHEPKLALTAGLALTADFFIAAIGGVMAPLLLEKMGRDPAVSSPIIVTFLTDFVGFFALLAIAAVIML